jgi:hypothetical protein
MHCNVAKMNLISSSPGICTSTSVHNIETETWRKDAVKESHSLSITWWTGPTRNWTVG